MQRYFAINKISDNLILDQDDIFHIANVMRNKQLDKIVVVYNSVSYLCAIYFRPQFKLEIVQSNYDERELNVNITLIQALTKGDKFDYIVQKSTELGVNKIIPLMTDRVVVKIENAKKALDKVARWQKIAFEAAKQSQRNRYPLVTNIHPLDSILSINGDIKLVAYEEETVNSLSHKLSRITDKSEIIVVIGPEGGFAPYEVAKMIEHSYTSVSLGKRILRTETAALYVLATIGYTQEG